MNNANLMSFLLGVILHGSALLLLVWLLERIGLLRVVAAREWAWRTAMFGGLVSASLQALLVPAPLLGNLSTISISAPVPSIGADTSESRADQRVVGAVKASRRSPRTTAPPNKSNAVATTIAAEAKPQSIAWKLPQIPLLQIFLAAWAAASLLMLARLLRSALALRKLLRRATPLGDASMLREWEELCVSTQVASARIAQVEGIASPIALPVRQVLVPAWVVALPARQRRAALAHELAHLQRGDPLWRSALALWRAVFCAIPLIGLALRRLDVLAELQCDAQAAQLTGDGRALAECLVLCIERHDESRRCDLVVAMATPTSPLVQRAELLLEGTAMSLSKPSLLSRCTPALALAASVLLLPTLTPRVVAAAAEVEGKKTSTGQVSIHSSSDLFGDSMRVQLHDATRSLEVNSKGKLSFNADESDLSGLSDGGSASIEETRGGVTRRVEYSSAAGKLQRKYLKNGTEQAPDAEAQQWLATIIPALLRETGIDAEDRVERFFARGGTAAVFAEIGQISSDYGRARYIGYLVGKHELTQEDMGRLLTLVDKIDSDYELRNILAKIFNTQKMDSTRLLTLLQVAAHIDSDYERAELLVETAHRAAAEPALRAAWLANAAAIDSDYEQRRSLQRMIEETTDQQALSDILAATASIGSDYEKREALSAIASKIKDPDAIATSFAKATLSIESDYERREALGSLLRIGQLGRVGALAVLDAAAGIDSDYDCRELLVAIAHSMPDDAQVRARYLEIAAKLSDYEREQAQQAIGGVNG